MAGQGRALGVFHLHHLLGSPIHRFEKERHSLFSRTLCREGCRRPRQIGWSGASIRALDLYGFGLGQPSPRNRPRGLLKYYEREAP